MIYNLTTDVGSWGSREGDTDMDQEGSLYRSFGFKKPYINPRLPICLRPHSKRLMNGKASGGHRVLGTNNLYAHLVVVIMACNYSRESIQITY